MERWSHVEPIPPFQRHAASAADTTFGLAAQWGTLNFDAFGRVRWPKAICDVRVVVASRMCLGLWLVVRVAAAAWRFDYSYMMLSPKQVKDFVSQALFLAVSSTLERASPSVETDNRHLAELEEDSGWNIKAGIFVIEDCEGDDGHTMVWRRPAGPLGCERTARMTDLSSSLAFCSSCTL